MVHRALLMSGLVACLGVTLSRTSTNTLPSPTAAISAHQAKQDAKICAGGASPEFDVEVVERGVTQSPRGETLALGLHVTSHYKGNAHFRHLATLTNSRGQAVQPEQMTDLSATLRPNEASESPVTIQAGLSDGYYRLRVVSVGASERGNTQQVIDRYFRVQGGSIAPATFAEWTESPGATDPTLVSASTTPAEPMMIPDPCLTCDDTPPDPSYGGYVIGTLTFFNRQGNYCPSERNCTGARYPQSEYAAVLPVRDVRVYISWPNEPGNLLGAGSTDSAGNFRVSWSDSTPNPSVDIYWEVDHKDGRFRFHNPAGSPFRYYIARNVQMNTATVSVGTAQYGSSSANADPVINAYDGAWRAWQFLSTSNFMLDRFKGVTIEAFNSAACPTSCAYGSSKRIILDDNAAFSPQHRIMHEMGHIVTYISSRDGKKWDPAPYTRDGTNGWFLTSPEWASASWEEGLATFYADAALYDRTAPEPYSCLSSGACPIGYYNVESSSRSACATDEDRWALTAMRYLRDAYDSTEDYPGETLTREGWEFIHTNNSFDPGTGETQRDEQWAYDSNGNYWIDDPDGHSGNDWRQVWARWGTNSDDAYFNNCAPAGD